MRVIGLRLEYVNEEKRLKAQALFQSQTHDPMFAASPSKLFTGIAQHISRERKIKIREKGLGTLQEGEGNFFAPPSGRRLQPFLLPLESFMPMISLQVA